MISEEVQKILDQQVATWQDIMRLRVYIEHQDHIISGLTQALQTTNQQLFEEIKEKQTWPVKTL